MRFGMLSLAIALPSILSAGQIYGTIVSGGQPLKEAEIKIQCASAAPVAGVTAADGAYRLNVSEQGQCTLSLPDQAGAPSVAVFSTPNPSMCNFELVKSSDGKAELRRR